MDDNDIVAAAIAARTQAQLALVGAEPYWMQDIRLAQRRLDAGRLALRSASERPAQPAPQDEAEPDSVSDEPLA